MIREHYVYCRESHKLYSSTIIEQMAASAANSRGDVVHVMVKTLSGDLIPISFDRSGTEKQVKRRALQALLEADPDFSNKNVQIIRPAHPEGVNVTNINSKMEKSKLSETTEDEILWVLAEDKEKVSAEYPIVLDRVDSSVEGYNGIIFYVFHLLRTNDRVMKVNKIYPDDDVDDSLSRKEINKHIRQFPIQTLIIYYDPVTKRHEILQRDYRTDNVEARVNILSDIEVFRQRDSRRDNFDEIMDNELDYNYYVDINEGRFRYGQYEEEKIDDIRYNLTSSAIQIIKEKIKENDETPPDSLIYKKQGGQRKRGYRKTKKITHSVQRRSKVHSKKHKHRRG